MTAHRLGRIIRARWWVLAFAGLFAVLAALLVAQSRNEALPDYEAVAPITYRRLIGEVDDTAAQERLAFAEDIALAVNQSDVATGRDPLDAGTRAEIVAVPQELRLLFIGRASTEEEAAGLAVAMRDRYLESQQLDSSEEIEQRIANTNARLREVNEAIATARQSVAPDLDDVEASSRVRELEAEVEAMAALYGALTAELLEPRVPPRPEATILAARDAASTSLREAQDELLNLQLDLNIESESVQLAPLLAEESQLRAALETYVGELVVYQSIGEPDPVELAVAGLSPIPLPLAALVGLAVGLLVGFVGLVVLDRIRQPLWTITELDPAYRLPELVTRPRQYRDHGTEPWYATAPQGQRKVGIQQLRSHVEGLSGFGKGVVVGLAALAGSKPDVHDIAADLAASLAHSGSWALLVDADYGDPSSLPEYRGSGLDLEHVVADPHKTLVDGPGRTDGSNEFLGVSIGERDPDAADLLAKPAFATMLDTAQGLYDAVIVACPPTNTASYHVLTQRLDAMVLVAIAGDLPPGSVTYALHTLRERRAFPVGVVLIRPKIGPLGLVQESTTAATQPARHEDEWQWWEHQGRVEDAPGGEDESQGAGGDGGYLATWDYRQAAAPGRAVGDSGEPAPPPPDEVPEPTSERITRRSLSTKRAVKAPPAEPEPDRTASPWSARQPKE